MKTLLILFCLLFQTMLVVAQNVSSNDLRFGVPFLLISPDARSLGMGQAGVATSPDVNAQYANPSKYAFAESAMEISAGLTPWLQGLSTNTYLAHLTGYWNPHGNAAIGASFRYFNTGSSQVNGTHETSPQDYVFDLSYSYKLRDHFSMGITVRQIFSDFRTQDGNAYSGVGYATAFDFSMFYTGGAQSNLSIGAIVSNVGTKINYQASNSLPLPAYVKIGVAQRIELDNYSSMVLTTDVNKPLVATSNNEGVMKDLRCSLGAEYNYSNSLFARAGYYYENLDNDSHSFWSVGCGARYNNFTLDLSYVMPLNDNLSLVNSLGFSLAYTFD